MIPPSAPLEVLLLADSATFYLDNQKNGIRGATIHHEATRNGFCPVLALARRVHQLYAMGARPTTPLSLYQDKPGGTRKHIVNSNITEALHEAAAKCGLLLRGYTLVRIGSHSIQASGTMALCLHKYSSKTIMKLGRWTLTTFMMYIHTQIAAFSARVLAAMAHPIPFINVG